MNQSNQSGEITDVKLPLTYIISGLVFFVLSQCIFLFTGHYVVGTSPGAPLVLSSVHSFILGFASMVAMGAMYQLVPVACQTQIHNMTLGYIQYVIYTIGVLGIVLSFLFFSPVLLLTFGTIAVIGVIIFLINMGLTLKKASSSFIKYAISFALFYFTITVLLGLWMAYDFVHPETAYWHDKLLYIHLTLGLNGWFALLIIGLSYKLVPMFSLSHHYESKLPTYTLWLLNIGIVVAVFSIIFNKNIIVYIGWLLIAISYILYMFQIRKILKNRLRKKLDLGLKVALFSWIFTIILFVVIGFVSLVTPFNVTLIVYTVIMGWIGFNILGLLFKIVPFLWWTYLYSDRIGNEKVPMLKDMVNENVGKWVFIVMMIMMLINLGTMVAHSIPIFIVSQTIMVIASVIYVVQILKVITGRS